MTSTFFLPGEWAAERILSPRLDDDKRPFTLLFEVPAERLELARVVRTLDSIEKRVRLALLYAFADDDSAWMERSSRQVLARDFTFPLIVKQISFSSIKVEITGDPKEIGKLLGKKEPANWRRRFLIGVLAVFGALGAAPGPTVPPPGPDGLLHWITVKADEQCQQLPRGSEVTLGVPPVVLKVPCGGDHEPSAQGSPPTHASHSRKPGRGKGTAQKPHGGKPIIRRPPTKNK